MRTTSSFRATRPLLTTLLLLGTCQVALAIDLRPSNVFLQGGGGDGASAVIGGATWDWSWSESNELGTASGYWEASFGRWQGRSAAGSHSSAWVTQFGVTPVFRYAPSIWSPGWFIEVGVGANLLAPIYRSADKRFSTVFNFGDHVALGKRFGDQRSEEISLRLEHFSNGGIKSPNPGENFIQLRYSHRW